MRALLLLALLPSMAMAQGLGKPGLTKSPGIGATTALPGVSVTNMVTCATSAATASDTVACLTFAPTAALGANDLILDLKTIVGGSTVFRVDMEGDVWATALTVSSLTQSSSLQSWSSTNPGQLLMSASAANTTASSSMLSVRPVNVMDANDSMFGVMEQGQTNVFSVDYEGDTIQTGRTISTPQTATIANDGNGGTAPATTLTPSASVIKLAYNDPQNSSVGTFSETGAIEGTTVVVVHSGSGGSVVFTESAGVQEVGGTACTLNLSDVMVATYVNASWHVSACRDN